MKNVPSHLRLRLFLAKINSINQEYNILFLSEFVIKIINIRKKERVTMDLNFDLFKNNIQSLDARRNDCIFLFVTRYIFLLLVHHRCVVNCKNYLLIIISKYKLEPNTLTLLNLFQEKYELELDENRADLAHSIYAGYLHPSVSIFTTISYCLKINRLFILFYFLVFIRFFLL